MRGPAEWADSPFTPQAFAPSPRPGPPQSRGTGRNRPEAVVVVHDKGTTGGRSTHGCLAQVREAIGLTGRPEQNNKS